MYFLRDIHQSISSPPLQVLLPGGVVHDGVYEGVDGVHDEGDDAEPDAGGGPLPARLRHVRQRPGQTHQREGADAVDGEAWAQLWRHVSPPKMICSTWHYHRSEGLPHQSIESCQSDFLCV